jgi:zinc/manganese transport system permease protein
MTGKRANVFATKRSTTTKRLMFTELFIAPFADYEFMRRALVGSVALALSGAPLGVFLILRRMSLAGDALSHAVLPGAAVGYLLAGLSLPAMTFGGLVAGLLVALASGAAARFTTLREDASLAAFYLVSLALGVTLVSLRGSSVDLLHVLFGSVFGLDDAALYMLAGVSTLTLVTLAVFYRALAMDTLDPLFLRQASALGEAVPYVFLGLVVLNLVAGFQALGTLMAVGLIMLPAAAARLWTHELGRALPLAAGIGAICVYAGLVFSNETGAPTGPAIILAAGVVYFASLIFGRAGGALRLRRPRRHLEG